MCPDPSLMEQQHGMTWLLLEFSLFGLGLCTAEYATGSRQDINVLCYCVNSPTSTRTVLTWTPSDIQQTLQFGANNRRAATTAIFDVRKFSHKSLFRILWLLCLCSNFSAITLFVYHRTLKICLLYYYNTQNLCWFAYTRMSGINQSKLANEHVLGHWRFSSISDMMSSHCLATTYKWTPYESIVAF